MNTSVQPLLDIVNHSPFKGFKHKKTMRKKLLDEFEKRKRKWD